MASRFGHCQPRTETLTPRSAPDRASVGRCSSRAQARPARLLSFADSWLAALRATVCPGACSCPRLPERGSTLRDTNWRQRHRILYHSKRHLSFLFSGARQNTLRFQPYSHKLTSMLKGHLRLLPARRLFWRASANLQDSPRLLRRISALIKSFGIKAPGPRPAKPNVIS